ncbi:MAG: hypothetical protein M3229_00605 [Actinomycetota bacterium]|nr:hypothetical protein [Actinomycetota bacterium]
MQRRSYVVAALVAVAIWLVGAWITKYTLEEMAVLTPLALLALGALAAVILLWVKVVRDSLRSRRE